MKLRHSFALAAFLAVGAATPALTQERPVDRHVMIINGTNNTMVHFYASNSSRTNWEEDILGDRILKPGQQVRINIDDGTGACLYDFRADFDDGDKLTRNGINVCTISSYRYSAN